MEDSNSFRALQCSSSESLDFERPYDWDLLFQEASSIDAKDDKIWINSLIDRFYWMDSLFENDKLSFQRTAYALDHCVKLYCTRIDLASQSTVQLLNNINVCFVNNKRRRQPTEVENDSDVHMESDSEDEIPQRQERRKGNKRSCTLAPNFDAIRDKARNENTFIGPLYYYLQSQFKEGSAKTLFLNSLSLGSNGAKILYGDDVLLNEKVSLKEERRREEIQREIDLRDADAPQINLRRVYRKFFQREGDLDIEYLTMCPSLPYLESLAKGTRMHPLEHNRIATQETTNVDFFEESTFERISFDYNMDWEDTNDDYNDNDNDAQPVDIVSNVLEAQSILNYENSGPVGNFELPTEHWRIQNIRSAMTGEERESLFLTRSRRIIRRRDSEPIEFIDFLDNDDTPFNEEEIFEEGNVQSRIPLDRYLAIRNVLTQIVETLDQNKFFKMFFREAPPIPNEEDSDEVSFDNNDYIYDIPDYNNSVSISLSDVNNNNVTMREIKCVKDTPLAYSKFSTYVNFLELKNTMDECLLASFASQDKNDENCRITGYYQLSDSFNEISHQVTAIFENDTELNPGKPTRATCFLALLSLANDYRLQLDPTRYHDNVIIKFQQN